VTRAATSDRGVVAAAHPLEAEAGRQILEAGGNAVDAVVAAAFAGFVVEPASCGLGGYGHLSLLVARERLLLTIDHGPRAPAGASPGMFTVVDGDGTGGYEWPAVEGRRNEVGPLAAAVPGAVAGLWTAHERAGSLPWAQVLSPAIELADSGLDVTWSLVIPIVERLEDIRRLPSAASFLLRNGDPPSPGDYWRPQDRLDTSALAKTLRLIAKHGAAGFHSGEVAQAVEKTVHAAGGILTASDLESYRPKVMTEQPATYQGYRYITANDQVGYEALNILERFKLSELAPGSADHYHLMAESLACAFVDNVTHYGDPDHVPAPLRGLASPGFAAERAGSIRRDRAAPRPVQPGDPWPFEPPAAAPGTGSSIARAPGTAQMTAADRDGNLAALITTVGHDFGSLVYVPEVGVFLNSSMVNFDPRPRRGNSIAPGAMPFFAVPSIVATREDGTGFAAAGSGGYRILSGVVHAFVNVSNFNMTVEQAVSAPRVYCQGDETFVDDRISADVCEHLAELGHKIVIQQATPGYEPFARVSAVTLARDGQSVALEAASDPVWSSGAAGV
jgi:gamma-glutamyltranspeptidase / glutathione hydrolase